MDAIAIRECIDLWSVAGLGALSVVLIMLSAMASGSEVAFFSLTRAEIEEFESRNDSTARRVVELLKNSDRLLATILVVNNMINICLVIIVTQLVDAIFIFTGIWEFIFNTIVITFILLL